MTSRPLPKKTLKNMFLKTLWEHRLGGRWASNGHSVNGILRVTLPHQFELSNLSGDRHDKYALTKEEYDLALEGIEELQRDGFLKNDPTQGDPEFKALTEKGKKAVQQQLEDMKLPSVRIEEVLSREELLNAVRDDFLDSKFDAAIRRAFLMVEEAVRARAKQPASAIGQDLMATAFSPKNGVLRHRDAQPNTGEPQAFFMLFAGAYGWFRSPHMHRSVGCDDPQEAAQILGLANLLLNLVDESV